MDTTSNNYWGQPQNVLIGPVEGGVTAPQGFVAAGVYCGVKEAKKDLALIYSEAPAVAAAMFTTNVVKAAPVLVTMDYLRANRARAIVANSGNANACTGDEGMNNARRMAEATAAALGISPKEVIVASTGVIGVPLPIERIESGIAGAAKSLSRDGGASAAEAILTTDTVSKQAAVVMDIRGCPVTIGGIAKGSGMIHPRMATMLAFLTTDANITAPMLKIILKRSVDPSFNMITVDGDTSTNDTIAILANGLAGNHLISTTTSPEFRVFRKGLNLICETLAKMIVKDGEGASRFIEVCVKGAFDLKEAKAAAMAIARSNLVKTAVFGSDPNWGRVLAAAGASGARFMQYRADVYLGDVKTAANGVPVDFDEEEARIALAGPEVKITVDLKMGQSMARVWTCDLTYDYVKINASYRS